MTPRTRQRFYGALLAAGASILIALTVGMMVGGAFGVLMAWVSALLVLEFVVDVVAFVGGVRWSMSGSESHSHLALRAGAAAALVHAVRVGIFALGRIGPWIDFDVLPEQRAMHAARWTWGEVYFASTMSVLGVVGVLVIWYFRRR